MKASTPLIPADRGLLLAFFWGLIWAKCFVVEYAKIAYGIEVNTFLIVWVPSLTMGVFCTILYLTSWGKQSDPTQAWEKLIMGVLLVAAVALEARTLIPPEALPGALGFMLGVGFFMRTRHQRHAPWSRLLSGVWIFISLGFFAMGGIQTFLWFSWALMLFLVLPSAIHFFIIREKAKTALIE
jgi:hypothetical protein